MSSDKPLPPSTTDLRDKPGQPRNDQAHKPEEPEEPCWACEGRGYLFPHDVDSGYICVARCDECAKFEWDDLAASHLGAELMKRDPRYAVVNMTAPGLKWEDLGASFFAVAKRVNQAGGDIAFEPINYDEAVEIAIMLGIFERGKKPKCCPQCGGTKFSIQLPAVFRWDGKAYALGPEDLNSDEFPIEDDATLICDTPVGDGSCANCDWTGKVSELKDKE